MNVCVLKWVAAWARIE